MPFAHFAFCVEVPFSSKLSRSSFYWWTLCGDGLKSQQRSSYGVWEARWRKTNRTNASGRPWNRLLTVPIILCSKQTWLVLTTQNKGCSQVLTKENGLVVTAEADPNSKEHLLIWASSALFWWVDSTLDFRSYAAFQQMLLLWRHIEKWLNLICVNQYIMAFYT